MSNQMLAIIAVFALSTLAVGYVMSVVLSVGNVKMAAMIFLFEFMNLLNRKKRIRSIQYSMNKQFKKFANEVVFTKSEEELKKILQISSLNEVKSYVKSAHDLMGKKNIFSEREARNFLKYLGRYGYFQSVSTASVVYSDPETLSEFMTVIDRINSKRKRGILENRRNNVNNRVKTYNNSEKSKENISQFIPSIPILFSSKRKRFSF